jgi:hypothetical protein
MSEPSPPFPPFPPLPLPIARACSSNFAAHRAYFFRVIIDGCADAAPPPASARKRVSFSTPIATETTGSPPVVHSAPARQGAASSLQPFLAHAQRVRDDLVRMAEAEQAERVQMAAAHGSRAQSVITVEALCCNCGRLTSLLRCACGADMSEALALWRRALAAQAAAAAPAPASSPPVADPVAAYPLPGVPAQPAGVAVAASAAPSAAPPDAASLEASLLAVVEAARRFSGTSAYEGTAARTEAAIDALMPHLPSPLQPASGAECSVCLQPLVSTDARERTEGLALVVLPCQHIFHRSCIRTWWVQSAPSPQCALCKQEVSRTALEKEWRAWITT